MSIRVRHKSDTAGRGLSGFWADCPVDSLQSNNNLGYFFQDDFLNLSQHISDQDTQTYSSYIDTGVTLKQLATEVGGVLQVAGNDADNDEGSLTTGGNAAGMVKIATSSGSSTKLWFEARLKNVTSVAANRLAFFIGLAEEGLAAANTLVDDTGAVADKDYVGFRVLHADGDGLDAVYNTSGGGGETVHKESASTLVADTYVKVGLYYDGTKVYFYVDGSVVDADGVAYSATNVPDGEELALLLATKVGAASETKLNLDWWACAQLV